MNKRQALKAAAETIKDLEAQIKALEGEIKDQEYFNRLSAADIKVYNKVIDGMIAGESPCKWCEDHATGECDKMGKGCGEWMLMWDHGEGGTFYGEENGDSTGVLEESNIRGEEDKNTSGETETL